MTFNLLSAILLSNLIPTKHVGMIVFNPKGVLLLSEESYQQYNPQAFWQVCNHRRNRVRIGNEVSEVKVSTKGRYALRLMLDLAMNNTGENISIKAVSARQGISTKYLEQIISMHKLNVKCFLEKFSNYKVIAFAVLFFHQIGQSNIINNIVYCIIDFFPYIHSCTLVKARALIFLLFYAGYGCKTSFC